ncbi:MAG: UDP-2,3-diacylglucosamine diphosphatase [Candidatus Marinimicrobia bacterium]|nr:UDP-2,3-diacylglucosamine diphosphatase [Candidatus Neomarinimicrobiota bacterium]
MSENNKYTYFFSDAHLIVGAYEQSRDRNEKVIEFIKYVSEHGKRLFIVGDLFDFWFEYKHTIPQTDPRILGSIAEAVESGVEVHYSSGNHDLWLGRYLEENVGVIIHDGGFETEIDRKKFYIAHGDGLFKNDRGYNFMKAFFRNPIAMWLFRILHPDLGIRLAKFLSKSSKENPISDQRSSNRKRLLQEFAQNKFAEGFDSVILGHIHEPDLLREESKIYINLGDWITHFTYASFDGKELSLCYWKGDPKK